MKLMNLVVSILAAGILLAGCGSGAAPEEASQPMTKEEMEQQGIGTATAPDGGGGGGTAPEASSSTAPTELGN